MLNPQLTARRILGHDVEPALPRLAHKELLVFGVERAPELSGQRNDLASVGCRRDGESGRDALARARARLEVEELAADVAVEAAIDNRQI